MANTIIDALVLCGVDQDMNNIIWNGTTSAERIIGEIFDNNVNSFRKLMAH